MPPTAKLILFISLLVAISINSTCAWAADDLRPGQMYNLAIQGDVDAQYLLGVAYYEGKYHFPQDLSKAEDWLEKAHQGGHELALVKLEEVRQAHSNKKAAQGSNGAQARVAIEANKFGDANLDPRHHRLIEDHRDTAIRDTCTAQCSVTNTLCNSCINQACGEEFSACNSLGACE